MGGVAPRIETEVGMSTVRVVAATVLSVGVLGQSGISIASADTLRSCRSVESFGDNTVVYTGTCPDGLINAISRNFYANDGAR